MSRRADLVDTIDVLQLWASALEATADSDVLPDQTEELRASAVRHRASIDQFLALLRDMDGAEPFELPVDDVKPSIIRTASSESRAPPEEPGSAFDQLRAFLLTFLSSLAERLERALNTRRQL